MSLTKLERRNRIRKRIRKVINGTAPYQDFLYTEATKEIYAQLTTIIWVKQLYLLLQR